MVLIHILVPWTAKGRTSEPEDISTSHTHTHTFTILRDIMFKLHKINNKDWTLKSKWGIGGMEIPQPIENKNENFSRLHIGNYANKSGM